MVDKIIGVCESALGFSPEVLTENQKAFKEVDSLFDEQKSMFKYTAEKVAQMMKRLYEWILYGGTKPEFVYD